MLNQIKVILISQFPIPYSKIGSWTTLYENYLQSDHAIDHLICENPHTCIEGLTYNVVKNSLTSKIKKKSSKNPYLSYLDELENIINEDERYIIQLVDNFGLAKALSDFLNAKTYKSKVYIQFFYHGFPPFYGNFESRWFFDFIDEMVLLTHASYLKHKETYTILPCSFSVLHNGIDTSKFFKLEKPNKKVLKKNHDVTDKTIFLWCSKDRPKKGLEFILRVWKRVYKIALNIELWVIGSERNIDINGVKFMGVIPNNDLPKYYQMADCYLFPTLTQEGFGLSLVEALHCGNYCIASNLGGVSEVLQNGKLIDNPHFIEDWEEAILDFLNTKPKVSQIPSNLYSSKCWEEGMNAIINNAKTGMQ